jgi:hypothetical protein
MLLLQIIFIQLDTNLNIHTNRNIHNIFNQDFNNYWPPIELKRIV